MSSYCVMLFNAPVLEHDGIKPCSPQQLLINDGDYMTVEKTQQSVGVASDLNAELDALRIGINMTQEEREKLKWEYIVEQNELLRLENIGLKAWIGTLLNSDGFDGGRYDAHDLRIARNQIKKMLDDPLTSI